MCIFRLTPHKPQTRDACWPVWAGGRDSLPDHSAPPSISATASLHHSISLPQHLCATASLRHSISATAYLRHSMQAVPGTPCAVELTCLNQMQHATRYPQLLAALEPEASVHRIASPCYGGRRRVCCAEGEGWRVSRPCLDTSPFLIGVVSVVTVVVMSRAVQLKRRRVRGPFDRLPRRDVLRRRGPRRG